MFNTYLQTSNTLETVFLCAALAGSLIFLLKIILLCTGSMIDAEFDEADIECDTDGHHTGHASGLKILSVHALAGFFMLAGWTGLACYKQAGMTAEMSIAYSLLAGTITMFISAYLFKAAHKLNSSGTSFTIAQALHKTGAVYQQIPAAGIGKIHVAIDGFPRELLAISEDGVTINSFKRIKVVRIVDQQTVAVCEIK